ncbi:MAG: TOPRIM domain protein [Candidatus Parvarchaeum acidiphilum ARMAN-4]|jgi:DNA primase|uniref:DNA primase DnaG n=1 Tax=Candidatus Parvarchaeum acidiphilum ARMAN-4 TaxID=662760 RepID=D2EFN1_PARA4|nr:MAG: TOPRIM domain protein [Candidatus Parvarchaeum acidiphilum ARMAN-4]
MAKIGPTSFKYILHAKFTADSLIDKPDVIGAVFGQTEGLLGEELDLREAQKNGKIGRINVESSAAGGKTNGEITIPTSLGMAETALIGAAIETIDRIGPSKATVSVDKIEDVRISKREYIMNRAQKLLEEAMKVSEVDTTELLQKLYEEVRQKEFVEYGSEKLPAGPDLEDSEEIIVVEGRADVMNMLKHGFSNIIGMNGTNIPKTVIDLSRKKIVTLFVDGDRGGDMIINSFMQQGHVDFIAKAPSGTEVEELSKKEINQALRAKVPIEDYDPSLKRESSAPKKVAQSAAVEVSPEIKEKVTPLVNDIIGTRGAFLVNNKFEILGRIPYKGVEDAILNLENIYMLVLDGLVTDEISKAAEESDIKYVIGSKILASSSSVKLLSYDDIGYKYR